MSENAKRRIHLRFEFYDLKSDIQALKFKNMKFGETFYQCHFLITLIFEAIWF